MLVPGYRNNLGRLRSMGSVFMFYIYHAFPLLQIVATQLESEGICSGLATDNAGSLAAVTVPHWRFWFLLAAFLAEFWWLCLFLQSFLMFPGNFVAFCPCATEVEASVRSCNAGLPPGDRVNGWVRARLHHWRLSPCSSAAFTSAPSPQCTVKHHTDIN